MPFSAGSDYYRHPKIVIYPGYYRNRNYRTYTVRNNISILLEDIIYNLIKQTAIVLRYSPVYENADSDAIAQAAERHGLRNIDNGRRLLFYDRRR